ncbi:autotransporter domain-containing protein [Candidatus Pelagibacter bacterium]|nr:autotransporter domain-containing protein [Candidatus Pelagibacter bacterium]MDA8829284.1 autotransporter domain-containing protein [Candidatus Pelagibacter bacterium]
MEFILRKLARCIHVTFFLIIFFSSKIVYSGEVTMPTSLTTDTTDFVLLSSSGVTPSISGYSGTLLVSATASAGNIKITNTTSINSANGYCGYDDNTSTPDQCKGSSLTEIGFRGEQDDINNALATLSFKGDGSTGTTITVSVTPAGNNYNPANGHYYQLVDSSSVSWADAKTAAEASTYEGLTGYLVTVTSESENNFLKSKISTNTWIGASDNSTYTSTSYSAGQPTEGTWQWVSGPENGKTFFCQVEISPKANAASDECSVATGYSYNNWKNLEPNDNGGTDIGQEDCAHLYGTGTFTGQWNDFPCDITSVHAYIIEYGGTAGESATVSGLTTLSINSTESDDYNLFDDKELVGIVEGQSENAKRFIYSSTNSILERMEWYRTTKKNENIKFQDIGIDIDITNKDTYPYAKLLDAYLLKGDVNKEQKLSNKNIEKFISELPLSKYLKNEFGMVPRKWKVWSSGYLKKGKIKLKSGKLNQEFDSDALTIGMDKIIRKNTLFGIAIRLEDQDTDVGQLGTKIKSNAKSTTIYSSWHKNSSTFIDGLVGYGYIDNDLTRIEQANTSNTLTGNRGVKQYFTSIKFNKIMDKDNLTSLLFGRFDYGLSKLESFSETGNIQALKFEEQDLKNKSISIGALTKYKKKIKKGYFLPYGRIEFFENLTPDSEAKASYISDPNTKYSYIVKEDYSNSLKLELGFDLNLIDSWYFATSIRRLIKNNKDFENEFAIKVSKPF